MQDNSVVDFLDKLKIKKQFLSYTSKTDILWAFYLRILWCEYPLAWWKFQYLYWCAF